ncbi:hypothetical protein [Quadrisphaera sp. INWT6]|uniref:hypothetical protein n=1 Tax=Quadrisphaera sp. INWT6 TaxID=2596917 RepID=UPI001892508D|nr:hypothetical protein [Quadrisphaera sp. INWT6]MBF5083055.1 hypothetical protein [Quadrisphaera sp. INWT6]
MDPASCVVGAVADAATASLGNSFADAMREGATWVIKTTIGWWVEVPAIDVTTSPALAIRDDVWWLSLVIAAAGVTWQGLRMAITHRLDPLLDIGRGLVTLALWAAVGITGSALALRAGDDFSSWVLDRAASGQVVERLVALAGLQGINSAGAAIVIGLLVMLAGLVQAVLMMFREGAVVVLAGLLVLAAAGNVTGYGRPWLGKVLAWMLALIAYKPVAALVYAVALRMTAGPEGTIANGGDPRTVIVGLSMIVMSVVALPVLMRFFSWATGDSGGPSRGLSTTLSLAAAGAQGISALRGAGSGGGDAGAHATQMKSDLGPAATSAYAAPGSSGGGAGGAASGAASTTAASSTASGASAGAASTAASGSSAGAAAGAGAAGGVAGAGVAAAKGAYDATVAASHTAGGAMTTTSSGENR